MGVTAVAAIVLGTYQLADGIYKIVRTVDTANKFFYAQKLTYLSVSSQKAGMGSAKAGVIGAVIVALITWGVIIYALVDAGVPAFSPQFNQAIGDGIGTTLTISMLAAISINAVGFLVALVLAIIDAILYFICEDDPDSVRPSRWSSKRIWSQPGGQRRPAQSFGRSISSFSRTWARAL